MEPGDCNSGFFFLETFWSYQSGFEFCCSQPGAAGLLGTPGLTPLSLRLFSLLFFCLFVYVLFVFGGDKLLTFWISTLWFQSVC